MKMTLGKATHGEARSGNDELVAFRHLAGWGAEGTEAVLAVLADDVGGMESEREAAHFALQQVVRDLRRVTRGGGFPEQLARALESANGVVCALARDRSEEGVLGVSVVITLVLDKTLYWCAVGDSRLYCLRNGELVQLTRDHTVAHHLRLEVLTGNMSLADLEKTPDLDALTSYLGMDPLPEFDANIKPFTLLGGDRLLVCSQGVHSTLSDSRMAATLVFDAQTAAEELVSLASSRAKGKQDAIHAAVICLPAPKRPRKGGGVWNSAGKQRAATDTKIGQMSADQPSKSVFGLALSRTGLTVAALTVAAILSVVVLLFLLFEDQSAPEVKREPSLLQADSTRVEQLPDDREQLGDPSGDVEETEQPLAVRPAKPKLQYRDLEPSRP